MYNPTYLVERVHTLGEAVIQQGFFQGNYFRAALCELIRQIPDDWESQAHHLCNLQMCPPAEAIVAALQKDLETQPDDTDRMILLHPMMRVAVSIRSGEISQPTKA
jgi:hypothetical protein